MENKFFYLSKEYAKNNGIWVYEESNIRIENHIEKYGFDSFEYEATSIPNCPWYDEVSNKIIEMPINIMVERGIKKLYPGEYITENNELVYVPKLNNLISGYWDFSEHKWKEGLSDEELKNHYLEERKKIFIEEVGAVHKIIFMEQNNLLSEGDSSEGLTEYLNQINPYNSANVIALNEVSRPDILEKYKV